jgi:type IV secretory pathway VirB2 component (pilin)
MGSRLIPPTYSRHTVHDVPAADLEQLDLGLRVGERASRRILDDTSNAHDTSPNGRVGRDGARLTLLAFAVAATLSVSASPAWAAGAGATMPWDGPLQALVNNLTGNTARALVLLAVVGAGLLWAFTRNEEGLKKLGQITFGGAIALGAATLMANLGFAGATF